MNRSEFIEYVGNVAKKDWRERRICVPSLVIAQALKESNVGSSELAVNANAIFGIKKNGWTGKTYRKVATEQMADGTYVTTKDPVEWRAYDSWEESIIDHNTYLATRYVDKEQEKANTPNWIGVIGVNDYAKAVHELQTAKYHYATSLTYEQSIIDDYIKKYELYKYDTEDKAVKILLISGHGNGDSGATAKINGTLYKEADETIKMVELLHPLLSKYAEVDYYQVNLNAYQDVQKGCVQVDFSQYDYVLEVHFNACVKDLKGNGITTGTEIYVTKADGTTETEQAIVNAIAAIGFKNRGVKKANYSVINKAYKASAQSALVEICFIDDADDMKLYTADRERVAVAIVNALISNFNLKANSSSQNTVPSQNETTNATTTASKAVGSSYECPFIIKCLDNLNIRKTAGGAIVRFDGCKKGIKYTITKVSGNWGYLKSGAGWISISSKYVIRA